MSARVTEVVLVTDAGNKINISLCIYFNIVNVQRVLCYLNEQDNNKLG